MLLAHAEHAVLMAHTEQDCNYQMPCDTLLPTCRAAADHICKRLDGWAQQFRGTSLEGFFKPCAYLQACARSGTKLSAGKPSASRL